MCTFTVIIYALYTECNYCSISSKQVIWFLGTNGGFFILASIMIFHGNRLFHFTCKLKKFKPQFERQTNFQNSNEFENLIVVILDSLFEFLTFFSMYLERFRTMVRDVLDAGVITYRVARVT